MLRDASNPPGSQPDLAHLRALVHSLPYFTPRSAARGKDYAVEGRVTVTALSDVELRGEVRGAIRYVASWRLSRGEWEPNCTCPVAPSCKHTYALACVVLARVLPEEERRTPIVRRCLPYDLIRPSRTPALRAAPSRPGGDRDAPLDRIRNSRATWDRMNALEALLVDTPLEHHSAYSPPLSDILHEPDADLRLWLLAQSLESAGAVPVELVPYLVRTDLAERHRARAARVLAEQFGEWTSTPRRSTKSVRVVLDLIEEVPATLAVMLQVLLTSKRLLDDPRSGSQVKTLVDEARRNPGDFTAGQAELLEILEQHQVPSVLVDASGTPLYGTSLIHLVLATSGSPLLTWKESIDPALAERFGIEPGGPVRVDAGSVRVEPVCESEGDAAPRITLACFLPDGRALPADRVGWIRSRAGRRREPTLVLSGGVLRMAIGDPPPPIGGLFGYTGGFELAGVEGRRIAESLAWQFPRFASTLGRHARVHRVRAAVSLELREDDWMQLRAFAIAHPEWRPGLPVPDGAAVFEFGPDGRWARLRTKARGERGFGIAKETEAIDAIGEDLAADSASAAPDPDAEVWLEAPDPERTAPVMRWLETTGAANGLAPQSGGRLLRASDRAVGWWLRLGSRVMERLYDAWEGRPPRVEWYGNDAARRILMTRPARGPRVKVESTGLDWFTVSVEWEDEASRLTEADLAKLRAATTPFVKLSAGWTRTDQVAELDAAAEALAELGLEAGQGPQRVGIWQLANARPEALAALDGFVDGDAARRELRAIRERIAAFEGLPRVEVPRGIVAELRPYQRTGLDFLAYTSSMGLGVVLADDMGLGKTVQALAWVARLREKEPKGGATLVVCPASVVHNWQREVERFAPGLRVLALTAGSDRARLSRKVDRYDLVLTNYALLRRDLEELTAVEWRAVILDEAQNIKNPDAQVSRAARSLKAQHRLALTGTPLENRALDLWSLLSFLNPGYLGTRRSFVRRYDRVDSPPHARRLLAAKLRPVLLRRLKQQVAPELPPRIEERRDCAMTPGQRKLYLAEVAKGREVLAQLAADGGLERNRISILAVLTRLRQVCCHPALVGGRMDLGSGKFDEFFELLEPLFDEGHKVLVFSQFVECLKLIAAAMEHRDMKYHMLTGDTPTRKRPEVVGAFELDPDPCAFLVSLKAGGTGLNLTAANYVVLFDPWWNPAVEAQAIDRTHRIGQDRTVIAYRMLSEGTLEERIFELQQRKAALANDLLGEDGFAKGLTREDLDYLLADVG